jgi:DNA modification methylase
VWTDIRGASTREGHPAPYPIELAERLIRLFSFAGDVVLDPFAGTGSTTLGAMRAGRSSIANELEPKYLAISQKRALAESAQYRLAGATRAVVTIDGLPVAGGIPAYL